MCQFKSLHNVAPITKYPYKKKKASKCRNTYLEINILDRKKDGKTDHARSVKTRGNSKSHG
jgi:hypothetical protein